MKESEDNLENFFRNRAEGNQYGFEEGDWAKMEAKLDAGLPVVTPYPFGKYAWMGLGAVITAMFFVTYIQLTNSNQTNSNQTVSNQADFQELSVVPPSTESVLKPTQIQPKEITEGSISISKKEFTPSSVKNEKKIVSDDKSVPDQDIISDAKNSTISNDRKDVKNTQLNSVNRKGFVASKNPYLEALVVETKPDSIRGVKQRKATYQFADFYTTPIEIKGLENQPVDIKRQRFYALSLLGSTDITSTAESAWGKPTFRFGVSGEYFVAKRWSIGIGVNLSKKKYQAKGTEYSPPKGFWTNGVVPDNTTAVCDVLGVPLTVNYFQPLSKKSNLIMSGGISSWFMLKEEYWYKYESNDPSLVSWWEGGSENNYWFSVINVSVAYEYNLNNKWSVAVGPYINIPLFGIGHGNVELRSFGLKGALRFNKFKLKF